MKDNNIKILSFLNFTEIIFALITRQIHSLQPSPSF